MCDQWTANTIRRCDSIIDQSMVTTALGSGSVPAITVFNTTATERDECVEVELPAGWSSAT
jgi:hypothetical protein